MPTRPTRRDLLRASAATGACAAGGLLAPRRLHAATAGGGDLNFLFVVAFGGWDTTRCLSPLYDNPVVEHEATGGLATYGNIPIVGHGDRPSVTDFFTRFHERALVLNGLLVPSVAHFSCLKLLMTGFSAGSHHPDWPAALAAPRAGDFTLPHLVISGPSYPGPYSGYVTRTGSSGQLSALLTGEILDWSDAPFPAPASGLEALEGQYVARRLEQALDSSPPARRAALLSSLQVALERGGELKDLTDIIDWGVGSDLPEQLGLAADVLTQGLARCVTVQTPFFWDTHSLNEIYQSWYWQDLFEGLVSLMDTLDATPGRRAARLSDETVVVVLSELSRTPGVNAEEGKDHWPYTSAMIVGPGITGDRVVGGYDDLVYGLKIDPATAEPDESGEDLSCEMLGATLLALGGEDPGEHLPGVNVLDGVLI